MIAVSEMSSSFLSEFSNSPATRRKDQEGRVRVMSWMPQRRLGGVPPATGVRLPLAGVQRRGPRICRHTRRRGTVRPSVDEGTGPFRRPDQGAEPLVGARAEKVLEGLCVRGAATGRCRGLAPERGGQLNCSRSCAREFWARATYSLDDSNPPRMRTRLK